MLKKSIKYVLLAFSLLIAFSVNAEAVNTLLHNPGDPIAGNPKGKVTVVEFFDYQCSHCMNMAPVIKTIIKTNPNVRIVYKDFPIRGPMSLYAARAALAANKQGKYYNFNHAMLITRLPLNEDNILDIAKSVGLNVTQLKKDMNSHRVNKILQTNYDLARTLNLNGTPAFFISKSNAKSSKDLNFVLGEMSSSELQDAINKAST
ncbi:MAG: DsbA family protein [Gammaproteobacteria bacterium]|nr:DsbA family protein [Gammaproteobacteria bacterium]MCW5583604.1 DsbA family protein [Gammaproteobacteria bacterium]